MLFPDSSIHMDSPVKIESGVPPLPPRYRLRDVIWGEHAYGEDDDDRVRVEFFTNERSLKERLQLYFIKNQRSSLRIRSFNFIIKILTCIFYVIRVMIDDPYGDNCCYKFCNKNHSTLPDPDEQGAYLKVHWRLLFFVNRPDPLWIVQVIVAMISLVESCLITYLGYKGNILHSLLAPSFLLELVNTVPFVITLFDSNNLKCLFIPVFLNCWLAKQQLENMFSDLNRVFQRTSSALAHRIMSVISTSFCLVFTSVCGIQHLQRGGNRHFSLFESFWFVMVTFSTVGYGDYKPDIWPSQLFMVMMIILAITILPGQLEKLLILWVERTRMGGTYSRHRAQTEKHVVLCTTALLSDTIMDFLNEFYAHPKLQHFYVVLLSPCELDSTMKMILQVPIWAQRVIYIQGSALKDSDLARCRMQDAEACFILAARNSQDRNASDQHTILRSWAVKDFAPTCPQYVQIYRPENKFHVRFAEFVVCEDEFKYALLANNTLCPGASTFVTLLLHTSRGREGQTSNEKWQQIYGKGSGNEIYHITLQDSKFFQEYEGKSFTYASFHAHRKFGVTLVGVRGQHHKTLLLNPGPRHIMRPDDTCFYMAMTKEENSALTVNPPIEPPKPESTRSMRDRSKSIGIAVDAGNNRSRSASCNKLPLPEDNDSQTCLEAGLQKPQRSPLSRRSPTSISLTLGMLTRKTSNASNLGLPNDSLRSKRPSIAPVPDMFFNDYNLQIGDDDEEEEPHICGEEFNDFNYPDCVKGCPPVTPYIGTSPCLCHLVRKKRSLCCIQLAQTCSHCSFKSACEYNWINRSVIVCADHASYGLFNFIVPLRSHWRSRNTLNPIVILLEKRPDTYFLEAISYFPLVYWLSGSIECIDDLLRAGINFADNIIIVNKESSNSMEEDTLSDCNTIVAVQSIYRLFPKIRIISELSQSSNMRFMQFKPDDKYALSMSKVEKKERERGSHLSYMFRLPFAGGNVFSANMLDTLLYQSFVKDYMIIFVRLLLGIDQAVGSGHLTCLRLQSQDMWIRTYGRLYQKLCSSSCEIPIGIYRSVKPDSDAPKIVIEDDVNFLSGECKQLENHEISQMVKCHMLTLGHSLSEYNGSTDDQCLSYVIINPSYDLTLELGDIVYLLRPSSLSEKATPSQRKCSLRSNVNSMSSCDTLGSFNRSNISIPQSPQLKGAFFKDQTEEKKTLLEINISPPTPTKETYAPPS